MAIIVDRYDCAIHHGDALNSLVYDVEGSLLWDPVHPPTVTYTNPSSMDVMCGQHANPSPLCGVGMCNPSDQVVTPIEGNNCTTYGGQEGICYNANDTSNTQIQGSAQVIYGCTDPLADNYNPEAYGINPGECTYNENMGCRNQNSCNIPLDEDGNVVVPAADCSGDPNGNDESCCTWPTEYFTSADGDAYWDTSCGFFCLSHWASPVTGRSQAPGGCLAPGEGLEDFYQGGQDLYPNCTSNIINTGNDLNNPNACCGIGSVKDACGVCKYLADSDVQYFLYNQSDEGCGCFNGPPIAYYEDPDQDGIANETYPCGTACPGVPIPTGPSFGFPCISVEEPGEYDFDPGILLGSFNPLACNYNPMAQEAGFDLLCEQLEPQYGGVLQCHNGLIERPGNPPYGFPDFDNDVVAAYNYATSFACLEYVENMCCDISACNYSGDALCGDDLVISPIDNNNCIYSQPMTCTWDPDNDGLFDEQEFITSCIPESYELNGNRLIWYKFQEGFGGGNDSTPSYCMIPDENGGHSGIDALEYTESPRSIAQCCQHLHGAYLSNLGHTIGWSGYNIPAGSQSNFNVLYSNNHAGLEGVWSGPLLQTEPTPSTPFSTPGGTPAQYGLIDCEFTYNYGYYGPHDGPYFAEVCSQQHVIHPDVKPVIVIDACSDDACSEVDPQRGYPWTTTTDITGVEMPGCTDPNACNYDITATVDDWSCILPEPVICGNSQIQVNCDMATNHTVYCPSDADESIDYDHVTISLSTGNNLIGFGLAVSDYSSTPNIAFDDTVDFMNLLHGLGCRVNFILGQGQGIFTNLDETGTPIFGPYDLDSASGNLLTLRSNRGYWVNVDSCGGTQHITLFGSSVSGEYEGIGYGNNLIALPANQEYGSTPNHFDSNITDSINFILSQGLGLFNTPGENYGWSGNLTTLHSGKGYWINWYQPNATNLYWDEENQQFTAVDDSSV